MKRLLFMILLFIALQLNAQSSIERDSIKNYIQTGIKQSGDSWKNYNPERGFFQKAYTDASDPRFMIANEDDSFRFGVGGTIHLTSYYDFNGAVNDNAFITWKIPVPTDYAGHFGIDLGNSKLNFKATTRIRNHKILSFMEIGFDSGSTLMKIRQAYISLMGFTIGQTWSVFMDLEAGPMTVDLEGPNTQVAARHPMIAYTWDISKHWTLVAAAEMPDRQIAIDTGHGVYAEYQQFPDFSMHIKYKGGFGHLQVAGILRNLYYYSYDTPNTPADQGHTEHEFGYGIALSGKINLGRKAFFTFQGVYGDGISHYIQDFSIANLDMIKIKDKYGKMQTLPMFGGYASIQYSWTEELYSSLIYGYSKIDVADNENFEVMNCESFDFDYSHSHYAAINIFWDFLPYGTIGLEYLYGTRINMDKSSGLANRFDLMIRYTF